MKSSCNPLRPRRSMPIIVVMGAAVLLRYYAFSSGSIYLNGKRVFAGFLPPLPANPSGSRLSSVDPEAITSRTQKEADNTTMPKEADNIKIPHETHSLPEHPLLKPPQHISSQALQQWCPFAKCNVTDLCHPCRRRYLIMAAAGRSGSTTLQMMLGSLPGIRMAGENNGMLTQFMAAISVTKTNKYWKGGIDHRAHFAWQHYDYPSSAFACVTQQMVETINPPPNNQGRHHIADDTQTIVGFKTIRFPLPDAIKIDAPYRVLIQESADFIEEHFPCSRIIVNIRSDIEAHAKSVKKNFGNKSDLDTLTREAVYRNKVLREFAKLLGPQRALLLDSSIWMLNVTSINHMVTSWLGFGSACAFDRPFEFNTVGGYRPGSVSSRPNPPDCHPLPA